MEHKTIDFTHLIGTVQGLSEKQLRAHFGLYEGYVKKLNEIESKLKSVSPESANYSFGEISELLRRRAVAYNGAYLHQMYFENLTGKPVQPSPEIMTETERFFGSFEQCMSLMRAGLNSGYGWALLCRSRFDESLSVDFVEEHHRGVLVGQDILLALDGWEHAYMIDYGTTKAKYIEVIEKVIDWSVVGRRFGMIKGEERKAA